MVDVSFDVESREYKGRHYTDLNAWKVFTNKDGATASTEPATATTEDAGNLPF